MRVFAGLIGFLCGLLFFVKPIFSDTAASYVFRKNVNSEPVTINDSRLPFSIGSIFVLPGDEVFIDYPPGLFSSVRATEGRVSVVSNSRRHWTAPRSADTNPTLYFLKDGDSVAIQVNVFVLVPLSDMVDGRIDAYRIDEYPDPAAISTDADYSKPVGFVKVSEANQDRQVSPHFTIGQFVAKQESDWPKYIAPGPKLYVQLEQILTDVNAQGFRTDSLTIMSGYRTPYYNAAIGNVPYSRHIYGDAADIFVDLDGDYRMDDLNGDGLINRDDAEVLASWVDYPTEVTADEDDGGLGVYAPKPWRGPFVHVDTRGTRARWIQ